MSFPDFSNVKKILFREIAQEKAARIVPVWHGILPNVR